MGVIEYLEKTGVRYEVSEHRPTFTAQRLAAAEHEPGRYVAKPVLVKVDGRYVLCVLAAADKIDLRALKRALGAGVVELAEEKEMGQVFGDCELGAEAPIGKLYEIETVMDKALERDDHIVFQAGTHEKAVRMSMEDYRVIANPKILEFAYK